MEPVRDQKGDGADGAQGEPARAPHRRVTCWGVSDALLRPFGGVQGASSPPRLLLTIMIAAGRRVACQGCAEVCGRSSLAACYAISGTDLASGAAARCGI
eukprot:2522395-Rhodomonas_salina.3